MATEAAWAAYAAAVVDVVPPDRASFRIAPEGPGSVGAWPEGVAVPVAVVTAWDPDSVRLAADVNAARHRILVLELATRGLDWWTAVGRDDHGHVEEGVAVPGLRVAEALALGRRHGQAAVYLWTPDAWDVVGCDGGRRVTLGWRLTGIPGSPD